MDTPQRNNDVYNHPQSEGEMNEAENLNKKEDVSTGQDTALNPNPRANENIPTADATVSTENRTEQTGSEITDGEDG